MKEIEQLLVQYEKYQSLLFKRGYLITTQKIDNISQFPFYDNWAQIQINQYYIYIHSSQNYYLCNKNGKTLLLIGHAYNPWKQIESEEKILQLLLETHQFKDLTDFYKELSEITGVFALFIFSREKDIVIQDSVGLMPVYYGKIENEIYLSSHSQLIADICNLKMDEEISELINSKFYLIGIRHLPGLKSPFKEVKAMTANTYLNINSFNITRFYPTIELAKYYNEEYSIEKISNILKNSMNLVSKKFNCSVSLTGGMDSKMTLAAASDVLQYFEYFSFYSTEAEKKDALAAHEICKCMNLEHRIIQIPINSLDIDDFDILKKILNHSTSYIKMHTEAEIRKILYLSQQGNISVEVKSHIAEIGRAFYHKKLGKKQMPIYLTPRQMSNLYKRNMFNRRILRFMDQSFSEFSELTEFNWPDVNRYNTSDMFYWEHRMSQWAALVKQDFDISHETTIIYNNRKLLDLFMNFKLQDRIDDSPQSEIVRYLNKKLFNLDINNYNAMKDKKRILLEKLFFHLN